MRVSEAIAQMQDLMNRHGDVDLYNGDTTRVQLPVETIEYHPAEPGWREHKIAGETVVFEPLPDRVLIS